MMEMQGGNRAWRADGKLTSLPAHGEDSTLRWQKWGQGTKRMKASPGRRAGTTPKATRGPPPDAAASRPLSDRVSLLLSLWATVLSQRVGPVAWGAQVTEGAACDHLAEAVGAAAVSVAVAPGPQAQGFPEAVPEAAGHEAVEHRVGC